MGVSLSSFDGGSGSSGGGGSSTSLSSFDAPKKGGGGGGHGGLFGTLLSHAPNLGVRNLVHMVTNIPYGLAALATGKGGYGNAWGAAGKGIFSSFMGTAESIPGIGLLADTTGFNDQVAGTLGEAYRPHKLWDTASRQGILPAVVEGLGNVSIAGGVVGKAAKAGEIGKVAAAAEAAGAAERAGFTAAEVTGAAERLAAAGGKIKEADIGSNVLRRAAKAAFNAEGLAPDAASVASRAKLIHGAELAAHPYTSMFRNVVRPVTRAAQAATLAGEVAPPVEALTADAARAAATEGLAGIAQSAPDAALARTRALLGGASHEAAGAPSGGLTLDEQLGRLTEMLPERPAPGADKIGPVEDAVRRSLITPVSPRAESFVAHLPEPAKRVLAGAERFIEGHQTKNVVFERMRQQLADRNVQHRSPEVEAGNAVAREFLVGKALPDGTVIGPEMADRLLGDEVLARLSGVDKIEAEAVRAAPEAAAAIRSALVKGGDRAEQSLPASLLADPAFDAALEHLTDAWRTSGGSRLAALKDSRLGAQGLGAAGSDVPALTKAEKAEMAQIAKGHAGLDALSKKAARERAGVEKLIARHTASSEQIGGAIERARAAEEAARVAFEEVRGGPVAEGRTLAQEATTKLPEAGKIKGTETVHVPWPVEKAIPITEHEVYRKGVVSGRQIEQAAKFGETAEQLVKRKAVLDKQIVDLGRMIDEYQLPSQRARLKLERKLGDKIDRLGAKLDDPSIVRTPDDWKPVYAALKDLHAAAITNPEIAKALEGLPERFSTVLRVAADKGFDPTHIRSFSPGEVRDLVYGQIKLGKRGVELGKTIEAGTRKGRYIGQPRTRSLSALAAALSEVTHEANTNAVTTFLEDTWVKVIPEDGVLPKGWAPWDEAKRHLVTSDSTGPGIAVKGPTTQQMIPTQVKHVLEAFSRDYDHTIFRAIKTATNPWKLLVLTMSPGWYLNNMIGNIVIATKEGVKPQDWANAWREYRRGGPDFGTNRLTAQVGRGSEAFAGMPHVEHQSYASDLASPQMIAFPRGVAGLKVARETGGVRNAASLLAERMRAPVDVIDNISRAAAYSAGKRQGLSAAEALEKSTSAFIDYQRMGPFERQVVSSIVPFYSFQKGMMRVVAKLPFDHPAATGFLMSLSDLNQRLNQDIYGTKMPEYYENVLKIPGLGTVNLGKFNPFASAADTFSSPQNIAQAINPFISAAVRNAYGAPSYYPHNAQGQLVAPDTTLNDFGMEVPKTNLAEDIGGNIGGVPIGRLFGSATQTTGLTGYTPTSRAMGVTRFAGVPAMSQEQLDKLLKRVMQYEAAQSR